MLNGGEKLIIGKGFRSSSTIPKFGDHRVSR
jgi:hypothetical protein